MAQWGIALSRWGNPFAAGIRPAAQLQLGRDASTAASAPRREDRARARLHRRRRRSCTPTTTRSSQRDARRRRIATRWRRWPRATRTTSEASIFYALSLAVAADRRRQDLRRASSRPARFSSSSSRRQPDHPGLAHYIIHSYDVPPLADHALEAARRYAKIAPSAPHALHMPSHTFTRVGYWQESIDTNIASAASAKRDGATAEELHATDYQTYAYLQTAQDARGRRAARRAAGDRRRASIRRRSAAAAPRSAGFFALAAIPARYALERGAWAEAVDARRRSRARFPYTEAMTYFARALGAAHLRQTRADRERDRRRCSRSATA